MKNISKYIREISTIIMAILWLCLSSPLAAQDEQEEKKPDKPARPAFESAWWFDGQTGTVYQKNTLEFVIQHRFGVIKPGNNDLLGIYGPSNIRMGLGYAPTDKLNVGFGYTKNKRILDFYAKYALLTQTRSNSMPISLTYYGNIGIETLDKENYLNSSDRLNYFNELIVMRRFGSKFSAQVGTSLTHYNAVKWEQQDDASWETMENDTWGLSIGARYKITSQMILMLGYDQPLTQHAINQPKPSINLGLEISTSSHAFQVFITNNNRIQPQENFMFNQNDFTNGDWLIGFNITRLWGL